MLLKNIIFHLIISSYFKMSRKRWVGAWKVNEDKRFVMVIVAVLGDRFAEGSVGARREDELGWSTHDVRLVAGKEGKLAEIEELRLENEVFLGLDPSGFSVGYPLSIRDARNPEKVLELLSPIVGKSATQLGEMKLTRIDTASIEHLLDSKVARWDRDGTSRDAKRLWRGRVGGLSVLDDIIATSNLGVEEFAKHYNKDWKKGAKFYRADTRFAIEVKNGYEIYPCQLIVAELKNGERYVYDFVEIKKPTLSASAGNANLSMTKRSTRTGESVASGGSISQTGGAAQGRFAIVTVVTDRKEKILPPRKPLAEVVGAARKRGDLPADDNESLPQNAASAQARFSIPGARCL